MFNVAGADVTFYGENNLDKLLYGCNSVQTSPVPDNAEIKVENLSFSGCYCCHTAPCDCSAFINANHYEADVSVSPVATVTSIHPTYAPSAGTPVAGAFVAAWASALSVTRVLHLALCLHVLCNRRPRDRDWDWLRQLAPPGMQVWHPSCGGGLPVADIHRVLRSRAACPRHHDGAAGGQQLADQVELRYDLQLRRDQRRCQAVPRELHDEHRQGRACAGTVHSWTAATHCQYIGRREWV